jgi:transposase InsO family protein
MTLRTQSDGAHAAIAASALAPLAPTRRQPRYPFDRESYYCRSTTHCCEDRLSRSKYLSHDYTQVLDDHRVLASVGSVGDAYDNALAESFVDTFKTELIKDRVWRSRGQMELAILEYVHWFNHDRLRESLGDIPPVEFEDAFLADCSTTPAGSSSLHGSGQTG